jgi:uncharacterized repeat protein (TIGR02059 family)
VNRTPSAVVNIYPAQSELVDQNYFYGKWTRSIDPEGERIKYRINFAQSIEALDDPFFYETEETYFLLPNLAPGVWYWRVTAFDAAGNSAQSPVWNFTVNGTSLPQPVNIGELPADPSLLVSNVANTSFTLEWPEYEDVQDPLNEVYYTIYVYEDQNGSYERGAVPFMELREKYPKGTSQTTGTTHTFNGLHSNTGYNWTIVAQCDASRTSIVGSSQIRTGNRAPTTPELLSPEDGSTDCATDTQFSWTASTDPEGDAFGYYLYLDTIRNTNRTVSPVEGISDTAYTPDGIEQGRTYYWYVMAKDENGAATKTDVRTFTTSSPILKFPSDPTPADAASGVVTSNNLTLQWQQDAAGRQVAYHLYFGKNPRSLSLKAEALDIKQYPFDEYLNGETIYYWQIEAVDQETGETARGALWQFKTAALIPPKQVDAQTNADGSQIELAFDKRMADPVGQECHFTVKRTSENVIASRQLDARASISVETIELKPGDPTKFLLSLDHFIMNGDNVTVSYECGQVQSADKAWLESYQNATVTNRVPGQPPILQGATATSNTLILQFDRMMKEAPSAATKSFIVQSDGKKLQIDSVERQTDETLYRINLKDGYRINYGEEVLLSYNKGDVKAKNEAALETFTAYEVVNTTAPATPVLSGAVTNTKGDKIVLTFDRDMMIEGDQSSCFTVQIVPFPGITARRGITVTQAEVMSDETKIELTLNQRLEYGEIVKVSYVPGTVKSSEGALLNTLTDEAVVNSVPVEPEVARVETDTSGKELTVTFDKTMKTPNTTQTILFNVQIERVEATTGKRTIDNIHIADITLNSDNKAYDLTLDSTINNGDSATLTYFRGGVESADGGWLKDFEKAITNDVTGESPELESATLTANGTEITAAFSMKMAAGINSQKGQFAVRVNGLTNTIQSMTRDADHKIYLIEVADEIVYGEQVTLSYTKGTVKAEYGTWLESFTDYVVNNQVAPLPPTVENVYTNTDGDYVYVALDKVLETPLNQQNNFALSMITPVFNRNGLTVENATLSDTDSRIIGLDLSGNMHYGDRYNLTFTPGLIETTEGATLSAFTNEITNNVPAPVPHFVSATLTADMKHVEVGFDQDMQEPSVDEMMQFSAMIEDYPNQITAASLKPGEANIIVLTLEKIVGRGNEVNVSYYKGTVKSSDGGILDTFLNQSADTSLVTDYLVSKGCGWHYSTIQEAVDDPAITDGSKIIVYPGTYREEIEIYDHSLHITSTDPASPAVVQSTVLKIPYEAVNPFDIQYVFDVYTPQTAGTIIEGFTIGNDLSFGVFAEETRVTVRNNVFDGMEEFPAIAVLACASDTVSGSMTEIASNTFRNADFQNGDAMIFVGEGSDAMLYGNLIENNTGSPGNGVWIDNEYADLDGYTTVYNHDGDPWREFFCPHASVEFVEHNSDPSFNNIYRDNGTSEGSNIVFIKQDMLPEQTANGTLETSPATWIAYATFSMTATYTFDGFTSEGSLTLTMDATFNTMSTQSRVKIGDAEERDLLPSEGNGQYINLSGITGEDVVVVFTLNQTVAENMPGTYPFLIEADRDGPDSLYDKSGGVGSAITLLSP